MNQYRKFNTHGTLRAVMLGTYYYPEYFSKIKNVQTRDPLMRIADEINQDLDSFANLLTSSGCQVIRAPQPTGFFESNAHLPPLHVRNTHAVVGNHMYKLNPDWNHAIDPVLRTYCADVVDLEQPNTQYYCECMSKVGDCYDHNQNIWYSRKKYHELAGSSWPKFEEYVQDVRATEPTISKEIAGFKNDLEYETKELGPLQGPNIINTEDTIFVDNNEYCDYATWFSSRIHDSRPVVQFTSKAGHVDGCFAVLGNKTILGIDTLIDYGKYFPGYHVISIPYESYQNPINAHHIMKKKVGGKWFLANEEHNDVFINFVETELKSWLGYVAESVFDVNVLALDEHTICVSNVTPEVELALKKRGIECVVVPWRHRFFVDGGLHCITLDLYRD